MRVTIARILGVKVTHYKDSGQVIAHVDFLDSRGQRGLLSGSPKSEHIRQVLARWSRERRQNPPTRAQARRMLHEGRVRGRPLTRAQRGMLGAIASGTPLTRLRRR